MLCKVCLRNGTSRDGGTLGLCWQHIRRKCRTCGAASAGEENCTRCAYAVDVARWKARANHLHLTQDAAWEVDALRLELLCQAKFHFHEAVEVICRGLLLALQAIHGRVPPPQPGGKDLAVKSPPLAAPGDTEGFREAA